MGDKSPAEIAAEVVLGLIRMSERRAQLIPNLSTVVRVVVEELDPNHGRDSSPTWWSDLPAWQHLDSFDRLRRSHDQMLVLEVQAGVIVQDLRGLINLRPVGSEDRPVGYSPARAHAELQRMALRRGEMISDAGKSERVLRPRLAPSTSWRLRAVLRQIIAQEAEAQEELVRLTELLTAPTDLRQSV